MNPLLAYLLPDPENSTPTRVVLVAGYLAAAFLWIRMGRQARGANDSAARWWFVGAVLLFLLAVNKTFNLRLQFEAAIRAFAKAGGWYYRRQKMQFVVAIVLPAVLATTTTILLAIKARGFLRRNPLALAGWVFLLFYLAVRQTQEWKPAYRWLTSIHYRDWRLALEVAGIALVVLGGVRGQGRPTSVVRPVN